MSKIIALKLSFWFSANLHGSSLQIWVLILELLKWEDLDLVCKSMFHGSSLQIWVLILELLKWEDLDLVCKSMFHQRYLYCICTNCLIQLGNGTSEECSLYLIQHGTKWLLLLLILL